MLLYHYYLLIHKVLPTPPIQFPKGSYCSRFSGNIVGQKFTTYLKANQTLMVTPDLSLFDIVVRNPKGKLLHRDNNDYPGKYTITPMRGQGDSKLTNIDFCDY